MARGEHNRAIGNENKAKVARCIAEKNPSSVSEIAKAAGISVHTANKIVPQIARRGYYLTEIGERILVDSTTDSG